MAISFVATRSTGTTTSGGSVWSGLAMAAGASITPGNTLILALSYRDAATPPTDCRAQPGNALGVDLRGNLWRRLAVADNAGASAAADNGAVAAVWVCHVTFPYQDGDVIDITAPITSRPMTDVAASIQEFEGVKRVDTAVDLADSVGNSTAIATGAVTPTAAGQLVYAVGAVASNPALTGDADVTDGAWSALGSATTGASGISRAVQTKIVTGTANQTWNITWAGAQQWAGVVVVLEEASNPWPFNNERLSNPEFPCPAGPEIIPVATTNLPVDTGSAYIFTVTPPPESSGSSGVYWEADLNALDPAVDSQHSVVAEVYPAGQEQIYNAPTVLSFGVPYAATLQGGATTTSGTAVDALAAAGGAQVVLETGQSVDCYWDFSTLAPFVGLYRIVEIRINYLAWKDDSAAPQPGEGLAVYWRDEDAVRGGGTTTSRFSSLYGAWLVNDYQNTAKRVYRSLGEMNGVPQIGATSNVQYDYLAACFTISDLLRMNVGDQSTMLSIFGLNGSAPSQTTVFLDTIQLEVVVVPEHRLAQGGRRLSSGIGFFNGAQTVQGDLTVPLYTASSSGEFWTAPENGDPISVVLREGVPASPSDWFGAQFDPTVATTNFAQNIRYASQERVGPSMAVRALVQPRETVSPRPDVTTVAWSAGQIAPNSVPESGNNFLYGFTLLDVNSYTSFWPSYNNSNVLDIGYSISQSGGALIGVDGASSYDYLRLIVKAPDIVNAPDLTISVEQPVSTVLATATITQAQVLALPDIGNGYREVHVPLSATITPSSASNVTVLFSSTTPDNDPWVPAYADPGGERSGYFANPLAYPAGTIFDTAVLLSCPLPDVDLSIDSSTIDVENAGTQPCLTTASNIPCITVNNAEQYDWLAITRIIGGVDETPVALLDVNDEIVYPSVTVEDDFQRGVVGGWGTPTVGPAWTTAGSAGTVTFQVASGRGTMNASVADEEGLATSPETSADSVQQVTLDIPATPTGASFGAGLLARLASTTTPFGVNGYRLTTVFNTAGTAATTLVVMSPGVTILGTLPTFLDYAPGTGLIQKLSVVGDQIRAKVWLADQAEPDWQVSVSNSAVTAAGNAGPYFSRTVGNTSLVPDVYFSDYSRYAFAPTALTWCDYGVPWDLANNRIVYAVQGYRNSDHRTTPRAEVPWDDTSVSAGAAFGIATSDALYAYVPGSDSGELELQWNRIYPVEMMPLAGKDYQIALRPSEVRGYSISVNVLVDKLGRCTVCLDDGTYDGGGAWDGDGAYDEGSCPTADPDDGTYNGLGVYDDNNFYNYASGGTTPQTSGAPAMAPTPFQQLNQLERSDRVELKLPGGHNRFVYLDTGAQTIIPVIGLFMAELTLTDVPPPSLAIEFWPETE